MSRKDLHEANFLRFIEKLSGKTAPEIYNAMKWSRGRYHMATKSRSFPVKNFESLRQAANLSNEVFYGAVETFFSAFNKKKKRARAPKLNN